MRHHAIRFAAPLVFGLASMILARTAADIKADLLSIIPAGKEARLAWSKGGPAVAFPPEASQCGVYVVSSVNGEVRKLYPAGTGVGRYNSVNVTRDGSRVVFFDAARSVIVVANFDGGSTKTVTPASAGRMVDYWRAADGSDWAVMAGKSVFRVNIDDPTGKAVTIYSADYSDDGCMLSDSGTQLVIYQGSTCGLLNVKTGAFVGERVDGGGCYPVMRRGLPVQYSHNLSGHFGPSVYNADGSKDRFIATSDTLKKWANAASATRVNGGCEVSGTTFSTEAHRWTREHDYLSFFFVGSKMNPILWNTATNKWVYIEDGLGCVFSGDMDMAFAATSQVERRLRASVQRHASEESAGYYSICGRRLSNVTGMGACIVSAKTGQGMVTRMVVGRR